MTTTLANRFWPHIGSNSVVRAIVLAVAGSLLVSAAAQIKVPLAPVPMTLQTLAVLMVGAAYGARLGAATLALYAVEGAIGLPFFAGGKSGIADSSLDYFLPGGSMGFIVGFIVAAWVVGKLFEAGWGTSFVKAVLATLTGAVVLYVPGLIWLAIWFAKAKGMDASNAIQSSLIYGLYPFVLIDVIKAAIAGLVPAAGLRRGK